jgi:6-pyruvoyl-tetrahydropterin synthase
VFEIEVGHRFHAEHAVSIDGVMEDLHSHEWQVRVALGGGQLDQEHLLVDFHVVEQSLRASVRPFTGGTLNGTPPFDRMLPTAERIAEFVGLQMGPSLPDGVVLRWVSVEEAPGCIARWYPPHTAVE